MVLKALLFHLLLAGTSLAINSSNNGSGKQPRRLRDAKEELNRSLGYNSRPLEYDWKRMLVHRGNIGGTRPANVEGSSEGGDTSKSGASKQSKRASTTKWRGDASMRSRERGNGGGGHAFGRGKGGRTIGDDISHSRSSSSKKSTSSGDSSGDASDSSGDARSRRHLAHQLPGKGKSHAHGHGNWRGGQGNDYHAMPVLHTWTGNPGNLRNLWRLFRHLSFC